MTTRLPTKKMYCAGCRDNFYNGNNPMGVKECWCFKTAKIVKRKFVPITQAPPWNMPAQKTLDCHHKSGYVKVGPDQTC